MVLKIGQMRSAVVFKVNTPTASATTDRAAVTSGGQNDSYASSVTTRGRLRKSSGSRSLDLGQLSGQESYELMCRYDSSLNSILKVNGKVTVDNVEYTIQSWEVVDQIKHIYKFQLNTQVGS